MFIQQLDFPAAVATTTTFLCCISFIVPWFAVNIGKMSISGINLDEDAEPRGDNWACEQWSLFISTGKLCTNHIKRLHCTTYGSLIRVSLPVPVLKILWLWIGFKTLYTFQLSSYHVASCTNPKGRLLLLGAFLVCGGTVCHALYVWLALLVCLWEWCCVSSVLLLHEEGPRVRPWGTWLCMLRHNRYRPFVVLPFHCSPDVHCHGSISVLRLKFQWFSDQPGSQGNRSDGPASQSRCAECMHVAEQVSCSLLGWYGFFGHANDRGELHAHLWWNHVKTLDWSLPKETTQHIPTEGMLHK
jgi:hypothetical protein